MKLQTALFAAVLLSGCSQQPSTAENKGNGSPDGMQTAASETNQVDDGAATAEPQVAPASTTASATGTVKSIDLASGKIVIAHAPVDRLKWPAMTMGFKASPEQLTSVQPGQQVEFEFESRGMDATIARISPLK
ncbi:MAG: copper-binding protein [Lysobacter sp.]|nr:copper-binding protein [Lysobacter sp.]